MISFHHHHSVFPPTISSYSFLSGHPDHSHSLLPPSTFNLFIPTPYATSPLILMILCKDHVFICLDFWWALAIQTGTMHASHASSVAPDRSPSISLVILWSYYPQEWALNNVLWSHVWHRQSEWPSRDYRIYSVSLREGSQICQRS